MGFRHLWIWKLLNFASTLVLAFVHNIFWTSVINDISRQIEHATVSLNSNLYHNCCRYNIEFQLWYQAVFGSNKQYFWFCLFRFRKMSFFSFNSYYRPTFRLVVTIKVLVSAKPGLQLIIICPCWLISASTKNIVWIVLVKSVGNWKGENANGNNYWCQFKCFCKWKVICQIGCCQWN